MPVASTLLSSVIGQIDPLSALSTIVAFVSSYLIYTTYIHPTFLSPLRHIPGPANKSKYNKYRLPWIGNMVDILAEEAGVPHRQWINQFGGIVMYRGFFGRQRILVADPKAIQHVFNTHSYNYEKPDRVKRLLGQVIGNGVLLAEGDAHKKQRKMLNPAFSHRHIKDMVPVMTIPAETLSKIWEEKAGDEGIEFDITRDLNHATLDIIGMAGFGYNFQALTDPNNELALAYSELFDTTSTRVQFLRAMIPIYIHIPFEHNRRRKAAIRSIDRYTSRLIVEKKAQAQDRSTSSSENENDGKDLMSILIRGNEQVGSLEDGKLSSKELQDQIMTFLAAGHETTSVTVTWMLHVFSTHQNVQQRVREEFLREIGRPSETSEPLTYDKLNNLPYLAACVKELLRIIPPVPTTSRIAVQDDNILGYDIPKGTQVFLSPAAMHKLQSVFGEDAEEFKPERWMDPSVVEQMDPELAKTTKFVTSDMTWAYQPFLTGPRNCIGSKFATMETKILLYYLLVNLEYHPAPGFKFKKQARVTWRPMPGMRLVVKRVKETGATAAKEQ
ncbi:hypothetical protein BGZ83_008843 [Gryganskiella cystojenkinii]|nr:hypothetical protein BGZ83_008843 [Gryganskiella cystojenkinii]